MSKSSTIIVKENPWDRCGKNKIFKICDILECSMDYCKAMDDFDKGKFREVLIPVNSIIRIDPIDRNNRYGSRIHVKYKLPDDSYTLNVAESLKELQDLIENKSR